MLVKSALLALMGLAAVSEATTVHRSEFRLARKEMVKRATNSAFNRGGNRGGGKAGSTAGAGGATGTSGAGGANNAASNTCLAAGSIQTGSFVTGQVDDVPAAGQSNSLT